MKNRISIYIITLLSAVGVFSSCSDLEFSPTDKFTEATYWTTEDKAALVLNAAYDEMYGSYCFFSNESMSDNMYEGRGVSSTKLISSGQADASNGRFSWEWAVCYSGIKTCHVFLENIDNVPNMNATVKERMKCEARFIRAFLYFRLTNWFGNVPFFTKDILLSESQSIAPTSQAEILTFIHNELDDIATKLPTNIQYATQDKGRITRGAAIAFNARVYLYSNNWEKVAATCEKLINKTESGTYALFGSYEGLFQASNEYNNEVILDYAFVPVERTWGEMLDMVPISLGGRVNASAPTQELVDDYIMLNGKSIQESGSTYDEINPYTNRDPRLTATVVYDKFKWKKADGSLKTIYIKPGTDPDQVAKTDEYVGPGSNTTATGYYVRKYYDTTSDIRFNSGLNLILIRYADILLMYAEAKNELGKLTETEWNLTIKALRSRAGFTNAEALNYNSGWTQEQLRNIIRRERRSELALEGLRIFDIRRWKIAETVLNKNPHGAKFGDLATDNGYIRLDKRNFNKDRDYLWAIPQSQRDLNPNLGQNPNY